MLTPAGVLTSMASASWPATAAFARATELANGAEPAALRALAEHTLAAQRAAAEAPRAAGATGDPAAAVAAAAAAAAGGGDDAAGAELAAYVAFLLQRGAASGAGPNKLEGMLPEGLGPGARGALAGAWRDGATPLLAALRAKPFGAPQCLAGVAWRAGVPLVGNPPPSADEPLRATLDLTLAPAPGTLAGAGAEASVAVEFTHDELHAFLGQLQTVQAQLDALV